MEIKIIMTCYRYKSLPFSLCYDSTDFKSAACLYKKMLDNNYVNVLSLTQYISKFATDKDYVKKVQRTIKELRKWKSISYKLN